MFRGLSESKDFARGKKLNAYSFANKQHQVDLGRSEWQQSFLSASSFLHNEKTLSNQKIKHEARNQSHFEMKQGDYSLFKSEKSLQFTHKKIDEKNSIKPIDKKNIMKGTFSIGNEIADYKTTNHLNFYDKSQISVPDVRWKYNYRNKDIITHQENNREEKCGFDSFEPKTKKNRISANYTEILPENKTYNIISGNVKTVKV